MLILFTLSCMAFKKTSYQMIKNQVNKFQTAMKEVGCPITQYELKLMDYQVTSECMNWVTQIFNQAKLANPKYCANALKKRESCTNGPCVQNQVNEALACAHTGNPDINPISKSSRFKILSKIKSTISSPFRVLKSRLAVLSDQWMHCEPLYHITMLIGFILLMGVIVLPFGAISALINAILYVILASMYAGVYLLFGKFIFQWEDVNQRLWAKKKKEFKIHSW
eukprot:NODE_89_length_21781_cov_0.895836.p12 type:complete len:224 gc:universal NODE_89_length_21781_cov_0.895836:9100-9771(+)